MPSNLQLEASGFALDMQRGLGPFGILADRDSWDSALRDILNREWFRRVWIFQELVRSRDPWIQLGRVSVRWDPLCQVVAALDRSPLHERTKMLEEMDRARSDKTSRSLFKLPLYLRRLLQVLIHRHLVPHTSQVFHRASRTVVQHPLGNPASRSAANAQHISIAVQYDPLDCQRNPFSARCLALCS